MSAAAYTDQLALYVAGEWRGASGRDTLPVVNPANGELLGRLPMATEQDIDDAVSTAQAAFPGWSQASAWDRERVLRRTAALVDERRDTIARLLTLENGKPLTDSHGEIDRVVETLQWCAEEGKRAYGRVLPPRSPRLSQTTLKRAVGPIARPNAAVALDAPVGASVYCEHGWTHTDIDSAADRQAQPA